MFLAEFQATFLVAVHLTLKSQRQTVLHSFGFQARLPPISQFAEVTGRERFLVEDGKCEMVSREVGLKYR